MQRIETVAELRELVDAWHEAGETIALVPTMGNLHAGHMSLVELAAEQAERVIVSVFVNPTQFGPGEDFSKYPRTPDKDARRLSLAGVDVMFEPGVDEMYPNGTAETTQVIVPGVSDVLEGAGRPGHFAGVASVVTRLFNICAPNVAVFGQKDYQQLIVLKRMVTDLHMPVRILTGETARADSGLALSSRNSYLNDAQKAQAVAIFRMLNTLCEAIGDGDDDWPGLEARGMQMLRDAGLDPQYVAIRRALDLSEMQPQFMNLVVLTAARVGEVRLLDNMRVSRGG